MSCYDTVYVRCPDCKKKHEIQTKAGSCELKNYSYQQVPLAIAEDLDATPIFCSCGASLSLICPPKYIRMEVIYND